MCEFRKKILLIDVENNGCSFLFGNVERLFALTEKYDELMLVTNHDKRFLKLNLCNLNKFSNFVNKGNITIIKVANHEKEIADKTIYFIAGTILNYCKKIDILSEDKGFDFLIELIKSNSSCEIVCNRISNFQTWSPKDFCKEDINDV